MTSESPDTNEVTEGSNKRRILNYLLEPFIQVKMGIYANLSALIFVLSVSVVFYKWLEEFFRIVIDLTELEEEVLAISRQYLADAVFWLCVLAILFMIINIIISVVYTHKMVGPAYAIRRHIRCLISGDFSARTYLRKGDTMKDVALELNRLSSILERKYPDHEISSEEMNFEDEPKTKQA